MALKDILASGQYPDDFVLAMPDGSSATIGEMRSMAASERQALIARSQALETAEAGVMERVTKLRNAGLLDDRMEPVIARRDVAAHVTAQTGLDENDPLFGPLVRQTQQQLAAMRAEVDAVKAQGAAVANATRQAMQSYLGDTYTQQFAREQQALPEALRSKVTLEQAVDFATKRKLTDEAGRLDISAAVDRLTWDARKEVERKDLEAKGAELADQKKALTNMQRPGVTGPKVADTGFKATDDKGRTLSLDEAISAAAQDDDLWASAAK